MAGPVQPIGFKNKVSNAFTTPDGGTTYSMALNNILAQTGGTSLQLTTVDFTSLVNNNVMRHIQGVYVDNYTAAAAAQSNPLNDIPNYPNLVITTSAGQIIDVPLGMQGYFPLFLDSTYQISFKGFGFATIILTDFSLSPYMFSGVNNQLPLFAGLATGDTTRPQRYGDAQQATFSQANLPFTFPTGFNFCNALYVSIEDCSFTTAGRLGLSWSFTGGGGPIFRRTFLVTTTPTDYPDVMKYEGMNLMPNINFDLTFACTLLSGAGPTFSGTLTAIGGVTLIADQP